MYRFTSTTHPLSDILHFQVFWVKVRPIFLNPLQVYLYYFIIIFGTLTYSCVFLIHICFISFVRSWLENLEGYNSSTFLLLHGYCLWPFTFGQFLLFFLFTNGHNSRLLSSVSFYFLIGKINRYTFSNQWKYSHQSHLTNPTFG